MAKQTDNCSHPEPESGKGLHTQESGDAGLSSNMQHNFSDDSKRVLPVADNGCHVGPTSQEKSEFIKACMMTEKVWSLPMMFESSTSPKDKSHLLTAEEGFSELSSYAALQENNMPSQAPPIALPEYRVKKEAAEALHRAAEDQPHVEAADNNNIIGTKMEKQRKRSSPGQRKRRNSDYFRKRAAGKYRKGCLLFLIAVLVPVTEGFAAKCFTCMDRDTCLKIWTIYHKDSPVYKGARNQTFQECCKVTPPTTSRNCSVCHDQSNITIFCSEDVGTIEPETLDGNSISNVQSRACNWTCASAPHPSHYGLISSFVLFSVVVAVLVIFSCRQKMKNRNGNSQH